MGGWEVTVAERRHADESHRAAASDTGPADVAMRPDDLDRIRDALIAELKAQPPTLGVVGMSGVGKSSTLNTLFKTDLPVSDTVACTKEFAALDLVINSTTGRTAGERVPLRVVDAPGLGEDATRDAGYLEDYHRWLPECDAVLWISAARNRAVSLDQFYLEALAPFHEKTVFALNQVDLVEPMDWDETINLPSVEQEAKIGEIVGDRRARLETVVGRSIVMEPYSAKKRYRLQSVFTALLNAIPEGRAWIFDELKNFRYDDFVPASFRGALDSDVDAATAHTSKGRRGRLRRRREMR